MGSLSNATAKKFEDRDNFADSGYSSLNKTVGCKQLWANIEPTPIKRQTV